MGGLGRGGDSNGGERDLKDFSGRNQAMAQMEQSRREDRGRVRDDEQELVSDMHPSEMLERYAGRDVAQVYVYKIYIYTHTHIDIYIYISIYIYTHTHIHTYTYVICMYVCLYIYVYLYISTESPWLTLTHAPTVFTHASVTARAHTGARTCAV